MMRRLLASAILTLVCAVVGLLALIWMAVALAAGSPRGWRLALGFDQIGNAVAGGDEDEVFSSRCWRCRDHLPYRWLQPAIDRVAAWLGDADHCETSARNEQVKVATRNYWQVGGVNDPSRRN